MLRRGLGCGCGGLLVLLVAVLAAGYFLVYRPITVFVDGWRTPSQNSQVPATSGDVGAPLTPTEVQKFVRIRRAERAALGNTFSSVQAVFQQIQNGQTPNLWQLTGVLREAGTSLGQVRTAQTASLVREQLSQERFNVIRGRVNRALGVPEVDFGTVANDLLGGKLPDFKQTVRTQADARTTALIAPFKAELSATAALGLLGL